MENLSIKYQVERLERKQDDLISCLDLGNSQTDLLNEILEIERELTLLETN